jgi:hypothetical protein
MAIVLVLGLGLALLRDANKKTRKIPFLSARFALLGKIDMDRDGKDDRDVLKQIIQEGGGSVDFDHPPPDVGAETGTLSPGIAWYVIDDRPSLPQFHSLKFEPIESGQSQFQKRRGELIRQARLNGIRPMPIERLLSLTESQGY